MRIFNLKNTILTILLISSVFASSDIYGQRWKLLRYEGGFGAGSAQVFGDIGGTLDENNLYGLKDIKFDETRLAFNLQGRYRATPFISIKSSLCLGFGKGTDDDSRNDRGRSYKATLFEFSGQIEHYFVPENKTGRSSAMYSKKGMLNSYRPVSAYTFIGIGITYSVSSHGDAVVLPVDDYRSGGNFVPVIPFGIGVKYVIDKRTFINGELGYRWALTDYIDGYKQTADSKHTDVYYFAMISLNYRLKTTRRNIPKFLDWKYKRYGI